MERAATPDERAGHGPGPRPGHQPGPRHTVSDTGSRRAYVHPPFRPAVWLPGPHAQTVAGRLLRRPRPPAVTRERIDTPDGDFLDLDVVSEPLAEDAPLVLVLHGLEGSTRRGYMRLTFSALARRGLRAVGLNFRSCSGEANRAPRLYHSGETEDVRFIVDKLSARAGGRPIGAIGFSLGGNALLKYLGEEGSRASGRVWGAAAVSVPFDLAAGAEALDGSAMGRFYTRRFLATLGDKALVKAAQLAEMGHADASTSVTDQRAARLDVARVRAARTFRGFDDAVTAPLHGFRDADDYYARCSSSAFLDRIRVPTLLVQAADDPFQPPGAEIARAAARSNAHIESLVTAAGGHVGFLSGPPWRPTSWVEPTVAGWITAGRPG